MTRTDLRRFAPFGLYLAGLAVLASGIIYILQRQLTLTLQISLAAIVLGLALFVILDPARALAAIKGRQARFGSNALLLTAGFIGILAVLNYLIFQNNRNWDLTEDQQNTLAAETLNTLGSLKTTVEARAFYSSQYPMDGTTRALLDNYKLNGKGRFKYEIIDPLQDPAAANAAKITRDGTIVLVSEGRMESVTAPSEQELTAAIVRLENPGERSVYFLTGHGEHDVNGSDQLSYSQVKALLESKNYKVNTLDLLSNPQVPEDARVVVVAGPTKPLADAEVSAIQAYLGRGGALVYLIDPVISTGFGNQPDPLANYLQSAWGIKLVNDVVVDFDNRDQPLVAIGSQFGSHSITNGLKNLAVLLPIARSVTPAQQAPEGVSLTQLVSTAQNSWGETNVEGLQQNQAQLDEGVDIAGPVSLAVSGINSQTNGRVVVIGDAEFASNQVAQALGNSDFFVNSVDWSAQEENMINLTPKQPTQRLLVVPSTTTMGLILLGSVFLLPGVFLLMGISTWFQRRQRG